jgi:hypothetical protein
MENHSSCRRTFSDATWHTIVSPYTALGLNAVVCGKEIVSNYVRTLYSVTISVHAADIDAVALASVLFVSKGEL